MIEKKLFLEIPGNHKFQSCVLTTFCFDFHYFESKIMRILKSKGISNISVFADSRMLDESIGIATGNIKAINSSYAINGVFSKGAFHSKITFCTGENNLLALFGSGNLTIGGMGKNDEIFSGLFANDINSPQLPLLIELWNYILFLTKKIKGVSSEKLDWISENKLLNSQKLEKNHKFYQVDEEIQMALLYNDETSIYQQLVNLLPVNEIGSIKVFCPYYDKNGEFLNNLSVDFKESSISVFLPEKFGNPPNQIEDLNNVQFYSWSEVKRVKTSSKNYERKLHAKIYHFRTSFNDYLLIGSPNATIPGFGTQSALAINDEMAVLYKFASAIDLDRFGLTCDNYKIILPQTLPRYESETEVEKNQIRSKSIKILGADRSLGLIKVYIESNISEEELSVNIFNHWGQIIDEQKLFLSNQTEFPLEYSQSVNSKEITYLQIFDAFGNPLSNKQMINNKESLYRNNPSPENMKLLDLENKIETDNWDDLDIVEFFNTIRNNEINENDSINSTENVSENETVQRKTKDLSNISYSQALEFMNNEEVYEHLSTHHHTVRIWDSIFTYFKNLNEKRENEDLDDEEQGNITSGRDKAEIKGSIKARCFNSESSFLSQKTKHVHFLQNYIKALDKGLNLPARPVNIIDFSNYLIVVKNIIRLTDREIEYKIKVKIDGEEIQKIKEACFFESFGKLNELDNFSGAILVVMNKFSSFLMKSGNLLVPKDEYQKNKFLKYKELVIAYTLLCLSVLKQKNSFNCLEGNSNLWLEAIASDLLLSLDPVQINYEEHFLNLIQHLSIKDINFEDCKHFAKEFVNQHSLDSKNFYFHKDFGFCFIAERIPQQMPKFYRLSKPGIFGDEQNNLIKNDLIEIETGKIFPSKQKLQKQK